MEADGAVAWRVAHSDVVAAAELVGGRLGGDFERDDCGLQILLLANGRLLVSPCLPGIDRLAHGRAGGIQQLPVGVPILLEC